MNDEFENTNAIQTAIAAGNALGTPKRVAYTGDGMDAYIIPEGYTIGVPPLKDVEQWLRTPVRKRGDFHFADVDSFVRYFNEHKTDSSRIFATVNSTGAMFRGIINFHGTGPDFNDHVCYAQLRHTPEWTAWMGNAKVRKTQVQFAEFLEEHESIFTNPSGADLLELIQTLEGKCDASIKQAVKLTNGQVKFVYDEEIELKGRSVSQGGEMELPTMLEVSVAPFEGGAFYKMRARLRWRIESQRIQFWYEPVLAHEVIRMVCSDILATIEAKTKVTPFKV